jgi:hypothetical protein
LALPQNSGRQDCRRLSVTPDPRIPSLHDKLRKIKGADFEVVVALE